VSSSPTPTARSGSRRAIYLIDPDGYLVEITQASG
jgi:hypothetical protein